MKPGTPGEIPLLWWAKCLRKAKLEREFMIISCDYKIPRKGREGFVEEELPVDVCMENRSITDSELFSYISLSTTLLHPMPKSQSIGKRRGENSICPRCLDKGEHNAKLWYYVSANASAGHLEFACPLAASTKPWATILQGIPDSILTILSSSSRSQLFKAPAKKWRQSSVQTNRSGSSSTVPSTNGAHPVQRKKTPPRTRS
jgi:hypothetical protein